MSTKKNNNTPAEENPEIMAEKKGTGEEKLEEVVGVPVEETKAEENKASPEEALKAEKDKYLRLFAEYDNYRKRSVKERGQIYSEIRSDTVQKFLPVYDNLVRALEQPTQDEAYRRGVEMTLAQFKEILTDIGVSEIEAVGKKFDPTLHEAVVHQGDETKGEGEIIEEFRKGFRLGDRVIRFSMVKVAN